VSSDYERLQKAERLLDQVDGNEEWASSIAFQIHEYRRAMVRRDDVTIREE
jgi:hypothetical protein